MPVCSWIAAIARAEGVYLYTPEGDRILDFNSQLMCVNVGHSHPKIVAAIKAAADDLHYVYPGAATEPRARLAKRLAQLCPGDIDTFFFTLGGAEANENAIKAARLYTGRQKILSSYRSYHGATNACMQLTGDPRRLANEPGGPGFVHFMPPWPYDYSFGADEDAITRNHLRYLEEQITYEGPETIAAVFVETVVGTNGILPPPRGWLQGLRALLDRHGILLVCDEVMCGFGRTGPYWGSDFAGLSPDMMTCAKGLSASYFPISALTITDEIYQVLADRSAEFGAFGHGFTYGGHPVGAAVALETLRIYDEIDIVAKARARQDQLQQGLRALADHPNVGEVRGVGMMAAIEFVQNKQTKAPFARPGKFGARVAEDLARQGILLRALGDTLVFAPPLIISEGELGEILDAVHVTLGRTEDAEAV